MNEDILAHGYAVVIAGGAGTRLWPVSRKARPKQFQAFTREATLLQHMVELAGQVIPKERILVIATPEFAPVIHEQLPDIPDENLLFEPARRDNGPAIALAMVQVHLRDPDAIPILLWADHNIEDPGAFAAMLTGALAASAANPTAMVMVGAKPTHPDTGLGYIQMGKEIGIYEGVAVFTVKRFAEKPDLATATRYVAAWEYLWNVGYKIMPAARYLSKFREVHPELVQAMDDIAAGCAANDQKAIAAAYEQLPKLSDEFLFTQHLTELLVIPADIGWSDVGSWKTLQEILGAKAENGLVTKGEVIALDSTDSLVFAKDRAIAVCGLKDMVVVDDGDALLVMSTTCAGQMKQLISLVETRKPELL